jgi:uncharacterized protein involved in cysteine biosynthesis
MSTSPAEEKRLRRSLPPDPAKSGFAGRFVAGAREAIGGVGLVFSDGRLVVLSVLPMLIHLSLLVGLLAVGFTSVADPLNAWLTPHATPSAAAPSALADVGAAVWALALQLVVGTVIVATSLVLALVLSSVVCDPFYDAISERVESLHVGRDVGADFNVVAMVRGIARELVATVLRIVVYAAVALPLWFLALTPLALLATPLGVLWTWLFLAWEFIARAFLRHAPGPGQRFAALFGNKAVFVGFGAVAWLMSFVPFTAPLLVAGATRLYLALAAHGHVATTLNELERTGLAAGPAANA